MSEQSIPKDWLLTSIDSVSVKGEQRKPADSDKFIYVDIGSIDRERKQIAEPQFLDGRDAPSRARKVINKGDVLVSLTRPNLNAVALVENEFDDQIASTGFEVIKPVGVESKYLFGLVRSRDFIDSISGKVQGALYPAAKSADVKGYPIPLPPIAEQKEIAERLDELLAQVDSVKTRLDGLPNILKRFRQSTLAAATSGKLTEEWRGENSYNAKTQLEEIKTNYPSKSSKNDLAKFHELPSSWEWALVKEVGSVQLGRQRAPKYHSGDNMRPYLRVANVMEGYIDTSDIMSMVFDEDDYEKYHLSSGDILLNEGQSHELVGRPAVFKDEITEACFTNTLVRFRPYPSVSVQFSYYLFLTYLKTGRFQEIASRTVNISHLGAGRFADMEFPFPPFEEQTEIVRRVEELLAFADQVEQRVKEAQAHVNHLTQSILAKAFRGELTADWRAEHPDLITGENSAAALLERIKSEREKLTPKKKTRKKKGSK